MDSNLNWRFPSVLVSQKAIVISALAAFCPLAFMLMNEFPVVLLSILISGLLTVSLLKSPMLNFLIKFTSLEVQTVVAVAASHT